MVNALTEFQKFVGFFESPCQIIWYLNVKNVVDKVASGPSFASLKLLRNKSNNAQLMGFFSRYSGP